MKEFAITESELHHTAARMQAVEQKISDAVRKYKLPDDYREVLIGQNYRCMGIREFLAALYRNDLEDFIENTEIFVDAITKITPEDIDNGI